MKTFGFIFCVILCFASCADPCDDVVCQNSGVCVEGDCDCAEGYEGTLCADESREKFYGTWKGIANCTNTEIYNVDAVISAGASVMELDLFMYELFNVTGILSDDGQSFSFTMNDFSGTFMLDGTVLRADVNIPSQSGDIADCTGLLDKQ